MTAIRDEDLIHLSSLRYGIETGNKARRLRYMIRDRITCKVVAKFASKEEAEEYIVVLSNSYKEELVSYGKL